jgi:hypothetical protein
VKKDVIFDKFAISNKLMLDIFSGLFSFEGTSTHHTNKTPSTPQCNNHPTLMSELPLHNDKGHTPIGSGDDDDGGEAMS